MSQNSFTLERFLLCASKSQVGFARLKSKRHQFEDRVSVYAGGLEQFACTQSFRYVRDAARCFTAQVSQAASNQP